MNDAPARRLAALSGLALAAAVAVWWLGSTRLALDNGADAVRPAAGALNALWLVRGIAVAMLGVRVGAVRGWRPGLIAALALVAPAWPLVMFAWSASATPWTSAAAAEVLLLAGCVVLPLIGQGVGRVLPQAGLAEVVATGVGTALAAAVWYTRGAWTLPLS